MAPDPDLHGLPPSYARVSLAVVTSSAEANLLGNIHGGEIAKLADSTADPIRERETATGRTSWKTTPGTEAVRVSGLQKT